MSQASRPSVTTRVLSILAVFEKSLAPRSLTDISRETGIPLSTTHRLLSELEGWNALARDGNGRYQIGIRLWELGQHAGRQVRDIARPLLQDLYELTQETVHIAIRQGSEVLYIDRIYGMRRVPQASRIGGRLPLHATAVGKAILAFEEDWVREEALSRSLEARTVHTHVNVASLRDELAQIRRQGFATATEEVRLGAASIAVPMFQSSGMGGSGMGGSGVGGAVGAALGMVIPLDHAAQMERHVPALRGIARRIEMSVGSLPLDGRSFVPPRRGGVD